MTFAAIGAAAVLAAYPDDLATRNFLLAAVVVLAPVTSDEWPWPEEKLRYGNGSVPEAVIASGIALGDKELVARGMRQLEFLLSLETRDRHLSVAGTVGRGPTETGAQFDQQPIEIAAIADAAAAALAATGDDRWSDTIDLCWAWFLGDNDTGISMVNLGTGAGNDGLHEYGRNENCGAESTLAMLSTYQQLRALTYGVAL